MYLLNMFAIFRF